MKVLYQSEVYITALLLLFPLKISAQSYMDYYNQGLGYYENQEYSMFIEYLSKADSLRPNHPTILYNLAVGYSRINDFKNTAIILNRRFQFNANNEFLIDEDFENFRVSKYFAEIESVYKKKSEKISTSELAFTINEKGFHLEGIAYDSSTERFLFTDIHNGTIVSYNSSGKDMKLISDLSAQGFWGAFGINLDPLDQNSLWVTTANIPEFKRFEENEDGKSALLKINRSSGEVQEVYSTNGNSKHLFGELTIAEDGTIYVSDTISPNIFKLDLNQKKFSLFFTANWLWNLQGLDISKDGKYIYISDYILGIYKLHIETKKIAPLLSSLNSITRGTDGLYLSANELILLQNGTNPRKIASIPIDTDRIISAGQVKVLDQNRADISEPTMGVFVGNYFYFIGNSPWGFYTKKSKPDTLNWPIINILKLPIKN
ncbi:MAG: hypothetical protein BalsKO_03190 [Balneolaceae bacterium]